MPGERATWSDAYWTPATSGDFGRYGTQGNSFGEGSRYPDSVFRAFKRARLRAAIEASKRVIHAFVRSR